MQKIKISIHAFRRECDTFVCSTCTSPCDFNPRIPQGMRLFKRQSIEYFIDDFNPRIPQGMRLHTFMTVLFRRYFNPRIPQGMRPLPVCCFHPPLRFQSTHSAGNATAGTSLQHLQDLFQSTHSAGNATL